MKYKLKQHLVGSNGELYPKGEIKDFGNNHYIAMALRNNPDIFEPVEEPSSLYEGLQELSEEDKISITKEPKELKEIAKIRFDSDTQSMVEDLWNKQGEIIDYINLLSGKGQSKSDAQKEGTSDILFKKK